MGEFKTQWLKNPCIHRPDGLCDLSLLRVKPYHGSARKVRLKFTRYTIGSDPSADIFLEDPFLSKIHATIYLNKQHYFIEDNDSKNGTFLNGTRVYKAALSENSSIRIGRSFIEIENEGKQEKEKNKLPEGILADSPVMERIIVEARSAAFSKVPILILGETGTGKDILAKLIHGWSRRKGAYLSLYAGNEDTQFGIHPFGCKGVGRAHSVQNGMKALQFPHGCTLFLDEIGSLSPKGQETLLSSMEKKKSKFPGFWGVGGNDVRLISASSGNLEEEVWKGNFRLDLYYRISGLVLRIPPLRERKEEIIPIAEKTLQKNSLLLDPECIGKLLSHNWPGNVRELLMVIRRAILLVKNRGGHIVSPEYIDFPLKERKLAWIENEGICSLKEMEKLLIQKALLRSSWSRLQTARELGISRTTLFQKMRQYGFQEHKKGKKYKNNR